MITPNQKILIIGNSGSGKTFLAKELSSTHQLPLIHLDDIFWTDSSCSTPRLKDEGHHLIQACMDETTWIIEGVFGDLASKAAESANLLLFLNLPADVCHQALLHRGAQNSSETSFLELLKWASQYYSRSTMTSYQGHLRIFNEFKGKKIELKSRQEISEWINGQKRSGH